MTQNSFEKQELAADYFSQKTKYYYLPISSSGEVSSALASQLGLYCTTERSVNEIRVSIAKAQFGRYSHIKIPLERSNFSQFLQARREVSQAEVPIVIQAFTSQLFDLEYKTLIEELSASNLIEWVIDKLSPSISDFILRVQSNYQKSFLTLPISCSTDWHQVFDGRLFLKFKYVHLYFGYFSTNSHDMLSCRGVYKTVSRLRKLLPEVEFLPPRGVNHWDSRVGADLNLEPMIEPCYSSQSANPQIDYSVIIPTFNNQNHLRVVIRHLLAQTVGLDCFEIVVVDDGSTDQTQELIMEMITEHPDRINFKYIYFPRVRQRVMGDGQYRAGIARNLGAKNAVGEYFCFLDSDIVVPPDYLQRVGESLQIWGAVQARRFNLKREFSHLYSNYADVVLGDSTFTGEKYWEDFHKVSNWEQLEHHWKYVCTHSLSLRRDTFWNIGGLKNNYIFYGFEDTDLGYKLVQNKHKLHLLPMAVYHLFHEDERSEFSNNYANRQRLLSKTAQIFYLHHLDDQIFQCLRNLMTQEISWKMLLQRLQWAIFGIWNWRDSLALRRLSHRQIGHGAR